MSNETVRVDLGAQSYDIIVGSGLLPAAGTFIAPLARRRVAIVTDRTVAALHLEAFEKSLTDAGIAHFPVILPPGEKTKDFAHLAGLIDQLLEARVERGTMLAALGGGVIGDLTGFAAAILLRGVDFIQLPTTLLAQVDSSVGGKTGINTKAGKNLVGSFHQPRLVIADTACLHTLPPREFLAGLAEIIKYGLMGDPAFFVWLEQNAASLIAGDEGARRHAIVTSCAAKAAVVAADEREQGPRALLNLGHTFGHALEAETGFGPALLHGEAVAIGMRMAFDFSVHLGLCPAADADRLRRLLAACGMKTGLGQLPGRQWDADRLLDHMSLDKKVKEGRLVFVLAHGIGRAALFADVAPVALRDFLAHEIAA